jgi:ADP-heptose:LPS heptosyltransferase
MGSLLLVRPGAIGDSLLAGPALAALRAARPADRLELVAHPAVGPLLERRRLVDRFVSRDAPAADSLFAPDPRPARDCFGQVGAAVAWSSDPDGLLTANLRALGADPLVLAPSRPDAAAGKHVAEHLLESLAPLGVSRPYLSLSQALLSPNSDWPVRSAGACPPTRSADGQPGSGDKPPRYGDCIVLHPGSGSPRKNWPPERFADLATELGRATGVEPLILVGPAEDGLVEIVTRRVRVPYRLLREPPLVELADLLAGCALYVGNDSGLSHLAGLCGAPTLALFGPTEPTLWRPLGPRVEVLRAEPLEALDLEAVLRTALAILGRDAY